MRKGRSFAATLSVALFSWLAASNSAQAAIHPAEPPPPRPLYSLDTAYLPSQNLAPAQPAASADLNPLALTPATRIAYQSLRDGNWEIYVTTADGKSVTRLTANAAADARPKLNRGATRAVFMSTRTGPYQVYLVNLDGSGLARLTNTGSDEGNPDWSPDGQRIVFESYRNDNQAEIYVMNADGSGQTRLTDEAAYDGQPAWSPDGKEIAFISNRKGGYRVWTMNPDGTNPVQRSNEAYSADPAWSPDSGQISYDADGDGNGWQDLWVVDATGANAHVVLTPPGAQTDIWANAWSPDGRYLLFTTISYLYYQGHWYWISAYLDTWNTADGSTQRVTALGAEWNGTWKSMATMPPRSRMNALPALSRDDTTISWSGWDTGGGVRSYDIQYRDAAGGGWIDWQAQVTATAAVLTASPGHTIEFRSRARDFGGNVESWPAAAQTATTFFDWRLAGALRDNRGTPLSGTLASAAPPPLAWQPSGLDGGFQGFFVSAGSHTLSWARPGYGAWPPTALNINQDRHFDLWLPPADNRWRNGGFESGLPSVDWQLSGPLTPTLGSAHTGAQGAALAAPNLPWTVGTLYPDPLSGPIIRLQAMFDGAGGLHLFWLGSGQNPAQFFYGYRPAGAASTDVVAVSDPGVQMDNSQFTVDGAGAVHVVWIQYVDPIGGAIVYRRRAPNGAWSNLQTVTSHLGSDFRLVAETDASVDLIWKDGAEMRYAHRSPAGVWATDLRLTNVLTPDQSLQGAPAAALDPGGNLHVVWSLSNSLQYRRRAADGVWSAVQTIVTPEQADDPVLAVDGAGSAHVAWIGLAGDQDGRVAGLLHYAQRSPDGIWSSPETVFASSVAGLQDVQIGVDDQQVSHLFWGWPLYSAVDYYYTERSPNGDWLQPRTMGALMGSTVSPEFTLDRDGNVHLLFYNPESSRFIYYRAPAGGHGLGGTYQSVTGYDPAKYLWREKKLALDPRGNATVVFEVTWQAYRWDGAVPSALGGGQTNDILAFDSPRPAQPEAGSLSQAITVPLTATQPVLSFAYQFVGTASRLASSRLEVWVDDGLQVTRTLSLAPGPTDWQLASTDLSAWTGQKISVTARLNQAAGEPFATVNLDEFSLGSSYPDLWVSHSATGAALPGGLLRYTLTYGNRGGVAHTALLTQTLPLGVTFLSASLPPSVIGSQLVWSLGDLAGDVLPETIVVTATVGAGVPLLSHPESTLRVGSATPELETWNNLVRAATFIGRLVDLPVAVHN